MTSITGCLTNIGDRACNIAFTLFKIFTDFGYKNLRLNLKNHLDYLLKEWFVMKRIETKIIIG